MHKNLLFLTVISLLPMIGVDAELPKDGLLCDLDAGQGVHKDASELVFRWENMAVPPTHPGRNFVERVYSNRPSPEGRPRFRSANKDLNGKPSLIFRGKPADGSHLGDDLINMDGPDVYDHLTQGSGYTWVAVVKAYEQFSPLRGYGGQDVNIFFGNLRNAGGDTCDWCGFWGGISSDPEYDHYFWAGSRGDDDFTGFTGKSGHYRADGTPHVFGKPMKNQWRIVAARMGSGTGRVEIEVFMDTDVKPINTAPFFVESDPSLTNPDIMAVGTERDA
ncbi:MAG: hypothetical protein KJT03_23645, partial [Verrucomicrobiae bacterium]|nr:hypothetical protein [Verrucomicrobiae bacterium]